MSFKRSMIALLGLVVGVFGWSSTAGAVCVGAGPTTCPVTGQAQFFIGNGLPIPSVTFGGVGATGGASVTQTVGGGLAIPAGAFTHPAVVGFNQPVRQANPAVFQVYTKIAVSFPAAAVTFPTSGRTGPAGVNVVDWCPGKTATIAGGGFPVCPIPNDKVAAVAVSIPPCATGACPGVGKVPTKVFGRLRYSRTAAGLLGGPARGLVLGTFNLFLVGPAGVTIMIPTTFTGTVGIGVGAAALTMGYQGATFGVYGQQAPAKGVNILVTATTTGGAPPLSGSITGFKGPIGPAPLNNITTATFGAPWTAGNLTITQPEAGPPESFMLVGSQTLHVGGCGFLGVLTPGPCGTISMVSGGVSRRSTTGPNANRGLLYMTVPEPAAALSALGALLTLVTCQRLARRRSR